MLINLLRIVGWSLIGVSIVFWLLSLPTTFETLMVVSITQKAGLFLMNLSGFLQGLAMGLLCLWASRNKS